MSAMLSLAYSVDIVPTNKKRSWKVAQNQHFSITNRSNKCQEVECQAWCRRQSRAFGGLGAGAFKR
jgi:hypothetical protein